MTGTKQIAGRGQTVHTVPMAARPGWKHAKHNRQQDTQAAQKQPERRSTCRSYKFQSTVVCLPHMKPILWGWWLGGVIVTERHYKKGGVRIPESQTVEEAAEVEETR